MTPNQKAKELVSKYQLMAEIISIEEPTEFTNPLKVKNARIELSSKKCALIAVDEIMESIPSKPIEYSDTQGYWQEVKQEIEKL